jgi:hypothetical protein
MRAEEIEVAALLYYVPDLLFWLQARDIARRLARLRRGMSYAKAEETVLGQPLDKLRLEMMTYWKVPEVIRDLLDPELVERDRQASLRACLEISHRGRHGWWEKKLPDIYVTLSQLVGMPVEEIATTAHINALKVARYGRWIPSPPAAAWLPMEPGPWPPEPDDDDDSTQPGKAISAAPNASQGSNSEIASKTGPGICPLPDGKVLKETLRNIEVHLDGSYTLNQMSAQILRGLHSGLGLSRLIFAMVTPDGKRVKIRFSLGIPAGDPLRHFEFELGGRELFCQLMAKSQGVWMNDGNRDRLQPMLGEKLQAMLGSADFFAMSLFNAGKPLGMIYADRGHGDCSLDPHTYTDFKMFCIQAVRGLSKLKPA